MYSFKAKPRHGSMLFRRRYLRIVAGKIWVGTGYGLLSQPVGWDDILNSFSAIPRVGIGYLWDISFAKPWLGYPLG